MAYSKKNKFKRILDIQAIYLEHSRRGVTATYIYNTYIYPVYRISRACFYEYLGTNARAGLKNIESTEKRQLSMF